MFTKDDYDRLSHDKKLQIQESFGFLNDINVDSFNGDQYLTKDGIPLNAISKMKESEFVKNWLPQFALNNSASNQNYFNFPEWGKISNQHTMCVIIVDDNDPGETLFVIKPLSSYTLTPEERNVLQQTSAALRTSIQATVEGQKPQIETRQIAETMKQHMGKSVHTPIHKLVPDEFYVKHGLYVESLRKVIWMKDEIFKGNIDQPTLFKVKDIFDKEDREGCATREEYEWIKSICPQFNIPEELLSQHGDNKVKNNQQDDNTGFDLESC